MSLRLPPMRDGLSGSAGMEPCAVGKSDTTHGNESAAEYPIVLYDEHKRHQHGGAEWLTLTQNSRYRLLNDDFSTLSPQTATTFPDPSFFLEDDFVDMPPPGGA
jgi:hypothetical protein